MDSFLVSLLRSIPIAHDLAQDDALDLLVPRLGATGSSTISHLTPPAGSRRLRTTF